MLLLLLAWSCCCSSVIPERGIFFLKPSKMSLAEDLEKAFGTTDLYELLGVEKTADKSKLKKAFHQCARQFHPDKAKDDAGATEKFQLISRVHALLSNTARRQSYDRTGVIDEEILSSDPDFSWEQYWRDLFPPVTEENIDSFAKTYKDSDAEKEDLRKAYLEHEGDWEGIFSTVPLSNPMTDLDRFSGYIEAWISSKEVPKYTAYSDKKARQRVIKEAQKEAKLLEKEQEKSASKEKTTRRSQQSTSSATQSESGGDLASLILQRRSARAKQFQELEQKYTKGKKKPNSLPSDEEFERIQAELLAKRAKQKEGQEKKQKKK
eukprot:m.115509 g.115509  ORF g.115509 m.115509 type:complete len:322 (+) comp15373_c0_seq1:193-1158(+)